MKHKPEDFEVGMIIEAIVSDDHYKITKGNAYEIVDISFAKGSQRLLIDYIDDAGKQRAKIIDTGGNNNFDNYFKIL